MKASVVNPGSRVWSQGEEWALPPELSGRERENLAEGEARGGRQLQNDHCSQREKPRPPSHWEGRQKTCAMFRMENQSELARNNVASCRELNTDLA